MSDGKFQERRMFTRYPCQLGGDFLSSDGQSGEGRIKNISIMGAGLVTRKALAVDVALKLKIITKNMHSLNLTGRVCWCKEENGAHLSGITFDKPLFIPLKAII